MMNEQMKLIVQDIDKLSVLEVLDIYEGIINSVIDVCEDVNASKVIVKAKLQDFLIRTHIAQEYLRR